MITKKEGKGFCRVLNSVFTGLGLYLISQLKNSIIKIKKLYLIYKNPENFSKFSVKTISSLPNLTLNYVLS